MAMTTKERTELRGDLVNMGYNWSFIDTDEAKITLYHHKAMLSQSGEIIRPVGRAIKNLPSEPNFLKRKGLQGLLGFPPGENCTCKWCRERNLEGMKAEEPKPEPKPSTPTLASALCPDCSFKSTAPTQAGASSRLKAHSKTHQSEKAE